MLNKLSYAMGVGEKVDTERVIVRPLISSALSNPPQQNDPK